MTKALLAICVCLALIAGYGYSMRVGNPGRGSLPTLGAPIAKRLAPYCLTGAILFGIAALVAAGV